MFSLTASDRKIIFISLVAFTLAVYFYFHLEKNIHSRNEQSNQQLGHILKSIQKPQIKYFSSYFWQDIVNSGESIFDGDTLYTNNTSEIVIQLSDRTEITVKPNTLIKITKSKDFPNGRIEVISGEVTATEAKATNIIHCSTNQSLEKNSELCSISKNTKSLSMKKSSSLKKKSTQTMESLPLFDLFPSVDTALLYKNIIDLQSSPAPPALEELSQTPNSTLEKVTTELKPVPIAEPTAQIKINKNGSRFKKVLEKNIIIPQEYMHRSLVFQSVNNQFIIFKWMNTAVKSNELRDQFLLQLSIDPKFNIKNEVNVDKTSYILNQNLRDGQYYWRVKGKSQNDLNWSDIASLQVLNVDTPRKTTHPSLSIR